MILLDSDVLLIDLLYQNDPKYPVNQQALQEIRARSLPVGITAQTLLEVVGILSFNTSPADIAALPGLLTVQYGLALLPDPQQNPDYAGCTVQELLAQMSHRMALGDAVQAVQIARHASFADCLLTWNARHFAGKVVVPVLTPEQWLQQLSQGKP